jgi:hypothetical protein
VLGAEVELLHVPPPLHVPDVQPVAVLVAEQELRVHARLDHVRRAPLAGDHAVVAEVPPEVVGELLRAAVALPCALDLERVVVEDEDAAGTVAIRVAEGVHVDAVRAAVHGVRAAVAGLLRDLLGLDRPDDSRLERVALRVQHIHARGAQSRHDQVAPLHVRVRHPGTERRRAGVPAEVVELVADVRHLDPPHEPAVRLRLVVQVDDT